MCNFDHVPEIAVVYSSLPNRAQDPWVEKKERFTQTCIACRVQFVRITNVTLSVCVFFFSFFLRILRNIIAAISPTYFTFLIKGKTNKPFI